MSISIKQTDCCGLRIVRGVGSINPKTALLSICSRMFNYDLNAGYGYNAAFMMFSNKSDEENSGNNLLKYFIIENKLGKITESIKDGVSVWIWEVDGRKTHSWYKKNS